MGRTVRCQGAILREHHLLLIEQREQANGRGYWLLPGGGQEGAETEEACVVREMREETRLDVEVVRLLLDDPVVPGGVYQRRHTYLCHVVGGEAAPGYEPELEAAEGYAIAAVAWLDLRAPASWDAPVRRDPWLLATLQQIRAALGYDPMEANGS